MQEPRPRQDGQKEVALAPAAIAQALVKQFGLSQDAAEQKVRQYWS